MASKVAVVALLNEVVAAAADEQPHHLMALVLGDAFQHDAIAAVTELLPDARSATRSLSAAATALEACKGFVPSEEWQRLQLDAFICQLHSDAKSLRATLSAVTP